MKKKTIKKYIELIDTRLGKALETLPPLPKKAVAWLSDYLWILTAIAAVLMAMSIISLFNAISAYMSLIGNLSVFQDIYPHSAYSSLWMVSAIVSIGFALLMAYLFFKAITPLREMKAYGWNLLFVSFLVAGVEIIVNAILSLNVFNFVFMIIFGGIFYVIGAYFLYQVKSRFVKAHKK